MTPGKSCSAAACSSCLKDCYAMKAYRQYPATRAAWDGNLAATLEDIPAMEAELGMYFSKLSAPRFFRVHVAGDFVTLDYAKMWARVAAAAPSTCFLAFTKCFEIAQQVDWPDNMRIVYSAWPGVDAPPAGRPIAWMDDGTETRIPENAVHCPGNCENCGMCWNLQDLGRDVYFTKH